MSILLRHALSNTDENAYEAVLIQEGIYGQRNKKKRIRLYGFQDYDRKSNVIYSSMLQHQESNIGRDREKIFDVESSERNCI